MRQAVEQVRDAFLHHVEQILGRNIGLQFGDPFAGRIGIPSSEFIVQPRHEAAPGRGDRLSQTLRLIAPVNSSSVGSLVTMFGRAGVAPGPCVGLLRRRCEHDQRYGAGRFRRLANGSDGLLHALSGRIESRKTTS